MHIHRDRIDAALTSSLRHLEDSVKALSSSADEKAVSGSLWLATADTEYAVFLMSLLQEDRSEAAWKQGVASKQTTVLETTLASAQELIENAKANVEADRFEKGYEETWKARNLLLKAQELLEKRLKDTRR